MPAFRAPRWLHTHALRLYRIATWAVLAGGMCAIAVVLFARFWVLPHVGDYRERIAAGLSAAAHQRIDIQRIEGRWEHLHLVLTFDGVTLYDEADQPALTFERTENVVSWWSLLYFGPRMASTEVDHPELHVRRDASGRLFIAGIEVNGGDGGDWSDWVLHQGRIVIRDARITWEDELRNAPPLELAHVDFRLDNHGQHHRFGLHAVPPANLASPIDVRGDLRGHGVMDPALWSGQLFAQLDYVDIAAWRTWIPFPVAFPHGVGAARVWTEFSNGRLTQITADTELSQVRTRLAQHLPELDLIMLKGRIGWKSLAEGFEFTTAHLALSAQDGAVLPPTDIVLNWRDGGGSGSERGELRANRISMSPLLALADRLPIDAGLRDEIAQYAPRGSFEDVALDWKGAWPQPAEYKVKARFADIGVNPVGRLPGFSGVSGQLDGNEKGGTLYLSMQNATAELPHVFRDTLALDSLTAKATWTQRDGQYEVHLNDVTFSNADLAGSVTGTYRTVAQSRGVIDLEARLMRADPRRISYYVPLLVGEQGHHWLDRAFLAGEAKDVNLRLKGDLDKFPFTNRQDGQFRVVVKVAGVTLDCAEGWPHIENIAGDVVFDGSAVNINARSASIFGVNLENVHAEIPDLHHDNREVRVAGIAQGPTGDFLRFIASSPLFDRIGHFTENATAEGQGRLALSLMLPLHAGAETRVAGSYQFNDNGLTMPDGVRFEKANGTLNFTESTVQASRITMRFLGGPATVAVAAGHDGTRINAQGRVDLDGYRRDAGVLPWRGLEKLSGTADWKAELKLRDDQNDAVFESTLRGVASDLPAPFSKSAQDVLPLRIERHVLNADQQRFVVALGKLVSAQWWQQHEDGRWLARRGSMSFGGAASLRDRGGLSINGSIARLDLGGWLALLDNRSGDGEAGAAEFGLRNISGIDLKVQEMHIFDRTLHDLAIGGSGSRQAAGALQLTLNGRELSGDANWNPQDKGRLQAHLKQLTIPPVDADLVRPQVATIPRAEAPPAHELPALDIVADSFTWGNKALGRLELSAHPETDIWRIDKLKVTNTDATLQADGSWASMHTLPRTELNVKLEVAHIDKLLKRLDQPAAIKGGNGHIDGDLSWSDEPYAFDGQKMSGHLTLEARKGQFAKLDPGMGRLLGILSLQSLPRRISLDFRDIFSAGLAFDEIDGTVKITRGLARTENLRIQGPSARVMMSGDVDLVAETQHLYVRVIPKISDSVSAAVGLAAGPIGAAAVFVAQKIFKDPIDELIARDYELTGSWDSPKVAKVDAHAVGMEPAPTP